MDRPTARKPSKAAPDSGMPSKTQRKRASLALQDLGEQLTQLSARQLAELQLPERLLDAVLAARRITKFGALRRQLQYIGRLMYDVDAESIAARLCSWKVEPLAASAYLHRLEHWRARLLQDETALSELADIVPGCDTDKLRELVRSARREQAEGSPPRSARLLFRELRRMLPLDRSVSAE